MDQSKKFSKIKNHALADPYKMYGQEQSIK